MRISLIGPTFPFRGGISHYTTLLYQHLVLSHEVTFFTFKRQYPTAIFPGKTDLDPSRTPIKAQGAEIMLDSMNPVTWVKVALKIVRSDQDLLIIPWWVSFWAPQFWTISFLVKRLSRTTILFLCHNVMEHESRQAGKWLTSLVLRNGDVFIVHSREDEQNLLTLFPSAIVRRSPHPTYAVFNTVQPREKNVRETHGIRGPIILFFGFVRDYKGLKYLIKAIPDVLSQVQVTLLIAGEFWKDKNAYLRLIRRLKLEKRIIIIDEYIPNEDVGAYFRAADLVVQPYVSATGSGVVQVAYGFGRPVIATSISSLEEVVEDETTGYLVPPGDSKALAGAIIRFFREGKAKVFSQNIEKRKHRYSWEKMVHTIEDVAVSIPARKDLA